MKVLHTWGKLYHFHHRRHNYCSRAIPFRLQIMNVISVRFNFMTNFAVTMENRVIFCMDI